MHLIIPYFFQPEAGRTTLRQPLQILPDSSGQLMVTSKG
eukprot:COSAG04_NODE_368_length_15757_cov_6.049176_5_plen_39_part_00